MLAFIVDEIDGRGKREREREREERLANNAIGLINSSKAFIQVSPRQKMLRKCWTKTSSYFWKYELNWNFGNTVFFNLYFFLH